MLGDQMTLWTNQSHPQSLKVKQVEPPTVVLGDEPLCEVLLRCRQGLCTNEHENIRFVTHFVHSLAIACELDAPVGSHRVGETNLLPRLITSNGCVPSFVACSTQRVDARIAGPCQKRRTEPF